MCSPARDPIQIPLNSKEVDLFNLESMYSCSFYNIICDFFFLEKRNNSLEMALIPECGLLEKIHPSVSRALINVNRGEGSHFRIAIKSDSTQFNKYTSENIEKKVYDVRNVNLLSSVCPDRILATC